MLLDEFDSSKFKEKLNKISESFNKFKKNDDNNI